MNAMLILDTLGIDALAEHLPAHLLWECVAAAAVRSLGEISAPIAPIKPGATTPTVSRPSSSARTAKPSRAVRASRPSSSPASRPVSVTAKVPVSGPVSTPAGPVASVSTPVPAVRAPAPSTNSPSEEGPDTTLSPAANTQPLGASRKPNRSARPARVRAGATSRGGTMPPPQAPAPMSDDDDSAFDVDTRVGGDPSLAGLDSIEDSPSDPGDEVTRYGHKI